MKYFCKQSLKIIVHFVLTLFGCSLKMYVDILFCLTLDTPKSEKNQYPSQMCSFHDLKQSNLKTTSFN